MGGEGETRSILASRSKAVRAGGGGRVTKATRRRDSDKDLARPSEARTRTTMRRRVCQLRGTLPSSNSRLISLVHEPFAPFRGHEPNFRGKRGGRPPPSIFPALPSSRTRDSGIDRSSRDDGRDIVAIFTGESIDRSRFAIALMDRRESYRGSFADREAIARRALAGVR